MYSEVVYNQEDDDHLPTLTVSQTLRFALATKSPRKKIEGVTDSQFREEVLNLLLSMLNIRHTADTIVSSSYRVELTSGWQCFCARRVRRREKASE